VEQSNKYSEEIRLSATTSTRRMRKWRDVTEEDFMKFIAIRIIIEIDQKPKQKHWCKHELLKSTIVPQLLSSDEYFEILRFLHFCDGSNSENDPLYKFCKIWDSVIQNSENLLIPGENLSINESLMLYKGRLHFKQYIPSKRSRFGIKTFFVVNETTKFF